MNMRGFKILKELFSQGRGQQLFNFGGWRFSKSRGWAHFQKVVVNFYQDQDFVISLEIFYDLRKVFVDSSLFRFFDHDFIFSRFSLYQRSTPPTLKAQGKIKRLTIKKRPTSNTTNSHFQLP